MQRGRVGESNSADAYLVNICLALCSVSGLCSSITAALRAFRICRVAVNRRHDDQIT
jgi:hypothetical protein